MKNRLRLYSGLVLFIFVTGHLINLSFGLISVEAMASGAEFLLIPWRSTFGRTLLMGSFLLHIGIAIWSIWIRRSFRMSTIEFVQICLGVLAPFILFGHVVATRFIDVNIVTEPSYYTTLTMLWVVAPWRGVMLAAAVLIVWAHGCMGLHKWLRIYPIYSHYKYLIFSLALLIPSISLAGYVAAGNHILGAAQQDGWVQNLFADANIEPWMIAVVIARETTFQLGFLVFLIALLVGRFIRRLIGSRQNKPRLYYSPGEKIIELIPHATLLESIRAANIPHASVCGGHGRCSTCRVRVGQGLNDLPPPSEQEVKVLSPAALAFSVRLACQLRPIQDLEVTALVEPDVGLKEVARYRDYLPAREMDVAYLFVDIRNSTNLSEERLPFDVVYILNLFFAEMAEALQETNGHYAQFNGDGLLAIYGLTSGPKQGCVEAIEGTKAMFGRLVDLNERLKNEVPDGLEIGIGIHAGGAIVGSMGPPEAPVISAIGDNVNIAARLESLTKEFSVPLVISATVAARSGLDKSRLQEHSVSVKGRNHKVNIYAIREPKLLTSNKMEANCNSRTYRTLPEISKLAG